MEFNKIRLGIFFSLLAITSLGFLYLLQPFFYPIFWAAVIASIFYPIYKKIQSKIKKERLSSTIVLFLVILIIILPLTGIASLLVNESFELYNAIDNNKSQINQTIQETITWTNNNPYLERLNIDEAFWIDKFSEATKVVTSYIFTGLKSFTQNSIVFIVMFILMLYSLYFFLKDGEKLLKMVMHLCPLGDDKEKQLYEKFSKTAASTLKGTLVVGSIQGVLGGLMFAIVGIQSAAIWGVLMVALSVLPIGSGLIWFPAGIIMLITGNIWQGLFLIIFGTIVISTIDNFLRPVLIGKEMKLHPMLILFATLGGLIFFGFTGFVIGPIVASLLVTLWEMYNEYYKQDLDNNR